MLKLSAILTKTQTELKSALVIELQKMKYKVQCKNGFIYAKGDIPVMLVAHMDTVHKTPVKTICYSSKGNNIIMSPEGIGGDDRAGVYMILQIIKKHRCHVLFCEDEEQGGIGAGLFAKSGIKPDINYMIELDRRGDNDAVFYDCDNPEFTDFITGFGFIEDYGSFSDISTIAPVLGVAAVNISAGYYNEHTRHEYIDMQAVTNNIKRVCDIVTTETAKFEYIEAYYSYSYYGKYSGYDTLNKWQRYDDYDIYSKHYSGKSTKNTKKNATKIASTAIFESLMQIPDNCHIKMPDGSLMESDGDYFIDYNSKVYEYLYEFDVAMELKDTYAYTEHGFHVKFILDDAVDMEVVDDECAKELEELLPFDKAM